MRETHCGNRLIRAFAPFRVALGLGLLSLSALLVCSLFLTTIDRAINSCGLRCGFLLDRPRITNPLDRLLVTLSKVPRVLSSCLLLFVPPLSLLRTLCCAVSTLLHLPSEHTTADGWEDCG